MTLMHTPDRAVTLTKMREQRERADAWMQDVERSLARRVVQIYGRQVTLEAVELVHGQHYGQGQLRRRRALCPRCDRRSGRVGGVCAEWCARDVDRYDYVVRGR